jgi:CMP-N-acetylneuraminic acid synthetase
MNVCLIPARKGSVEIPDKNIIPFRGIPLICHSIDTSKECNLIHHTFVSTDCENIASISAERGAIVPFLRPSNISGSLSPDIETFEHFLKFFENTFSNKKNIILERFPKNKLIEKFCDIIPSSSKCNFFEKEGNIKIVFYGGFEISFGVEQFEFVTFTYKRKDELVLYKDIEMKMKEYYEKFPKEFFVVENLKVEDINMIVQLRPTYPVRSQDILKDCINIFDVKKEYDSLRTVVKFDKTPFKMYTIHSDSGSNRECGTNSLKELVPLFPELKVEDKIIKEPYNQCRQILPTTYMHDGCIDIIRPHTILNLKSMTGNKIYPYIIHNPTSVDIDNIKDLQSSEKL